VGVVCGARPCDDSSQLGQGKDVRCAFTFMCSATCPKPGVLATLCLQMLQTLSFWPCWQAWVPGGRRKLPTSSRSPVETISRMQKHAARLHLISGPLRTVVIDTTRGDLDDRQGVRSAATSMPIVSPCCAVRARLFCAHSRVPLS
jgi:hypothetical protein